MGEEESNTGKKVTGSLRPLREIREFMVSLLADPAHSAHKEVLSSLAELLEGIETGDVSCIDRALADFGLERGNELFSRVGNLARSLHDSVKELREHLLRENYSLETTNIPEATDKLERIIKMTFSAAENTFRYLDLQAKALEKVKIEIDKLEEMLNSGNASAGLSADTIKTFITQQRTLLEELAKRTLDIVVEQDYQDLMEQILRKVVRLLNSIERQLTTLISLFSLKVGLEAKDNKGPEEFNQEDADAMLKKLGF